MEIARLLPQPGERHDAETVERTLLISVSVKDGDTGVVARRGLVGERILTSIEQQEEEVDLFRHEWGVSWLARNNPFLTTDQSGRLDEQGLIRVDTVLQRDDILASVLKTVLRREGRPARPGKCWVTDDSWTAPTEWEGATVTEAQILRRHQFGSDVPTGVWQRLRITVRAEHELAVGDILFFERKPLAVLSRFVPDAEMPTHDNKRVDLTLPRAVGQQLGLRTGEPLRLSVGKSLERASDAVQARSMELYSLITKEPLLNSPCPAQRVETKHIRWLLSRGFAGNVAELTSLKSDDLGKRSTLNGLLQSQRLDPEGVPDPGAPESLLILQHYLRGLSLEVEIQESEHAVALSLRPATDEDILHWSSGPVRTAYTVEYRTLEEVEGGLFCPQVFGSPARPRRRQFGHILLPCPVVCPLWHLGTPSVLETVLKVPNDTIERILRHEAWVCQREDEWETRHDEPNRDADSGFLTGALAIEAMLKSARLEASLRGSSGRADVLAQRLVPVMPAEGRPLVLLDNGNFATADVNDLYRELINRANRLFKLEELKAPSVILHNERRLLQKSYAALQANCLLAEPDAVFREDEPRSRLVDCLELLFRHLQRKDGKRVEWCGKARTVGLSLLPSTVVKIPERIYDVLCLNPNAPVLLTSPDSPHGTFVSLLPHAHHDNVLILPTWAFSRLGLEGPAPVCIVHRPLGRLACIEATKLLHDDPGPVCKIPDRDSWIETSDLAGFATRLMQAAWQGDTTIMQSPRGLLVGGTGQISFAEDADLPFRSEKTHEMDSPSHA